MIDTIAAGDSGGAAPASAPGGSPPSTPVTPEPTSPSTTTAAGAQTIDTPKGPVPYERFEEVNTRYNRLKWAEDHDGDRVRQQAQFFKWLDTDPQGAFRYMEDYLSRAGVLKREAQHTGYGHAPADDRPQPDIVVPETGQLFYSAPAAEKLAQWVAKQSIAPIEERLNSFEADRTRSHVRAEAAQLLAEAETWPHYKEHEGPILREMERDRRLSLEGAYRRVVMPKLRELERQAVLGEIKSKSTASTVSPQSTTASQTTNSAKLGWSELFKREMAKRGGRA